ncbi:MAG: arylsulfotransferase family protein [Gammaproteobacteria bacterium]
MTDKRPKQQGVTAWLRNNWITLYFRTAILMLVLAYGVFSSMFNWFPAQQIRDGIIAGLYFKNYALQYARVVPSKHLRPMRQEGDGVSRYQPEMTQPGVTLLSGMWEEELGVKMVSLEGVLLHEWRMSFNKTWPVADHLYAQPHDWDSTIHGMVAQSNGDLIFNFEHLGIVSIDACSEENWKIASKAHHIVHKAYDGNLWYSDSRKYTSPNKKFPWLRVPFHEDTLVEITPEGEILREISLLEVLYDSGWENVLVESSEGTDADGIFRNTVTTTRMDITHLNDIEVLSPDMADAFDLFEAGDIVLSLRNLDLVMVMDGRTEKVKWAMTGPWLMQHDPDFLDSGKIMIYDNRARIRKRTGTDGSRILEVDPVTREVEVIYKGSPEDIFFTPQMGKQQPLDNGNILIAEPEGGRAFEVTRDGEIVWEFINRWSEEKVAVITEALRLPDEYFELPFNCE